MAYIAKVNITKIRKTSKCLDLNECELVPSVCSPDANCTNSPGRYTCSCNPGFYGNGSYCQSKEHKIQKFTNIS